MEQSQPQPNLLDPKRFIRRLQTRARFVSRLPRISLNESARGSHFHRRVAASAFRSHVLKQSTERSDLDTHLLKLATGLKKFYKDSRTLDYLRHRYGNPQHMPPRERDRFYESKGTIIGCNDTLVDVIGAGASRFDFDQLLTFMTDVFFATGGQEHANDFHERAREAIVGMRNEIAVEQLLTSGGINFRRGTAPEDSRGGDYFIDGVPIDFKSNETSAQRAKIRAEEGGYDSSAILWSHIRPEDFEGKLALPRDRLIAIFAELKPELDAAITAHKQPGIPHAV